MFQRIYKFFASVQLAVFSILSLAAVLAVATFMGSVYGMHGSQVAVYQRWWFSGLLLVLAVNVLAAATIRFPWKIRQTGFVLTHLGIIVLLVGSLLTQKLGVDGSLPVAEKTQENEVIMGELHLSLFDEKGGQKMEVPVPETHVENRGTVLDIALSTGHHLVVDRFIPRANQTKAMIASPVPGVGIPAVHLELTNSRFDIDEWLQASTPDKPTDLNLGPAIVSLQKLWSPDEEKTFFKKDAKGHEAESKYGSLTIAYKGRDYKVDIGQLIGKWSKVSGSSLELKVERYLPYAVVENNHLISKSDEPRNPAVEVLVKDTATNFSPEKHTVFAFFPEFSTLHGAKARTEPILGVDLKMTVQQQMGDMPGMGGGGRGHLFLAQSSDGKRLLYRVLGKAGDLKTEGEAQVGKNIATGWMDIQFKVVDWLPAAIEDPEPQNVEDMQGQDDSFPTAIRFRIVPPGGRAPAAKADDGVWLYEGMGRSFSVGGQELFVQYHKNRLLLPFHIYLEKFTMGTNPGTQEAATYTSNVRVKDPTASEEKTATISMNEPLQYGGYTFYQASYQMSPGQPAVSVFSVNYDPGRWVKYAGAMIMVFGILLMFYLNPQYLKIMTGKGKESA